MGKTERRQSAFIQMLIQKNDVRPWNDVIEDQKAKIKGYCTDQSNSNHRDKLTDIIAPGENIDNGEVYDIETGITKRDLI